MEHCEEDWVTVAIEAQQILVEKEDPDVGKVPGQDDQDRY